MNLGFDKLVQIIKIIIGIIGLGILYKIYLVLTYFLCYNVNMKKLIKKKVVEKPILKKPKEPIKEIPNSLYSVSLNIFGKETKYEGNTLFEIFDMIKPDTLRGKAILIVKKEGLKSEIILKPFQLKRLMFSDAFRQILNKRINLLLK